MSPASVFASGRTALMTGGANGVGLAVAQLCRKHKMNVAIVDNNTEYLKNAKDKVPEAEFYQMDVTKPAEWKELKAKLGRVPDLLMLNSGIGQRGTWGDAEYFHNVCRTAYVASASTRAELPG
jgi:NAD(P)-dependent dehydrogenase (short-subunit alcohol dehydrogenase family)